MKPGREEDDSSDEATPRASGLSGLGLAIAIRIAFVK